MSQVDIQAAFELLRESERTLTTLIGNLPGFVYRCANDPNWTVSYISSGVFALTGHPPSYFIEGRGHFADFIHLDDRDKVWQEVQAGLSVSKSYTISYRIVCSLGKVIWAWERGCGVYTEDGKLVALEGLVTDVTKQKEVELALQKLLADLEEKVAARTSELEAVNRKLNIELGERRVREKELMEWRTREERLKLEEEKIRRLDRLSSLGTLAAGIAHQINNPVGGALLAAQFALAHAKDSDGSEVTSTALSRIVAEMQRCGEIVRNVLRLAKDEELDFWLCDINKIVLHAAEIVRESINAAGAELSLKLGRSLPRVSANPLQIEQVIVNLLQNSVEALLENQDSNGVKRMVQLRTELAHGCVSVAVEDNGGGMGAEERDQMFDPFFTTRHGRGGTGLGLSVVHGIVSSHNARLDAQSELGSGTVIKIIFPKAAPLRVIEENIL